jgi:SAM-dependent methyltransferase
MNSIDNNPDYSVGNGFFNQNYLNLYHSEMTPEKTIKESNFIEETLKLNKSLAILDLGCGQGRHAITLKKRGYDIYGLDFSDILLNKAKTDADSENIDLNLIYGDMRRLPLIKEFDRIYNYFTSFGYFSDEENEGILNNISEILKINGLFLIDMVSRESALINFDEIDERVEDERLIISRRELKLKESRIYIREEIVDKGETESLQYSIRLYTLTEMIKMLSGVGFETRDVFGSSMLKTPYTIYSKRMVILAEKVK